LVGPALWLGVCAIAAALVWAITGIVLLTALIAAAGVATAAWRVGVTFATMQTALAAAERDRSAMEEALRQSQKMEAVGRLTVGIAHDFNNHLTVISNNVELLKRRLDGSDGRLDRHIEAAMQGVQRAAALTGRLLSFGRQREADHEPVDVGTLLTGLADLLGRTLGEGIALDLRLPNDPWFTWADITQMENALLSLALTAREHIADGGRLGIAVSNVHLDEAFAAANPGVLPGPFIQIAIGQQDRTQPRLDPSEDPSSAGLTTASAFVRAAGGCLLRSDPTAPHLSIRLFLPRYQPPTLTRPPVRSRADGRPTILVVEDDVAVRKFCVEALRELNYDVLEAPDAMEAFRLIADCGGIDLLLTDIGLPGGVSGRALADAACNVDPTMRVVFTTGYARTDTSTRHSCAVLHKPFTHEELADKVREALAGTHATLTHEIVQS
jgi:CheY-like chemotaxis protein